MRLYSVRLSIDDEVRLLVDDRDRDSDDRERLTFAGTIGRVIGLDQDGPGGSPRYHVGYPNGAWMIYEDSEVYTVGQCADLSKCLIAKR